MTKPVTVEIDTVVNAAYITLSDEMIVRTLAVTDAVNVDLDAMNMAVGVEVLSLDAEIPFARLESECHVHSASIEILRTIRPSVGSFFLQTTTGTDGSMEQASMHKPELVA